MMTCYFDESGGEDIGWTFVCGWAATTAQWDRFEIDWKLFLAKNDVPHFHMKEFSQSKGCYEKWKYDEAARAAFIATAAEIIAAHTQCCFASLVSHEDFTLVDNKFMLVERLKSPYALVGRTCIALARNWRLQQTGASLDMEFIFDDGGPDKGGLLALCDDLTPAVPSPSFKPSRDWKPSRKWPEGRVGIVQLQAADYLAYELRKLLIDLRDGSDNRRRVRKSLTALPGRNLQKSFFAFDRLVRFCTKSKLERRHDGEEVN